MSLTDTDIRTVLHRATDDLVTAPTLVDDVRRGGRRRVVRRRALLGAGLGVVAAASAGGVLRISGTGDRLDVSSPLLDDPTRGNLAYHQPFLNDVLEAWRRQVAYAEIAVRGEPHVVWAGETSAGRAAYVIQRTADNPVVVEPRGDRQVAVAAFVAPGPKVLTIGTLTDVELAAPHTPAVLLGPDYDTLVVLDYGRPVELSLDLSYTPDGRVQRRWTRMTSEDDVIQVTTKPQRRKVTVALAHPPVGPENMIYIDNATEILYPGGRDKPVPPAYEHTLPGAEQVWGSDRQGVVRRFVDDVRALTPYVDPAGHHTHNGSPLLTVYGATPDGRRLLVQTIQYDDDPSRVIVLLARGDAPFQPVASGFANWQAPVPVRLALPGGQGILVAAEGKQITYRLNGAVHDAGRDAALLPAAATDIAAS